MKADRTLKRKLMVKEFMVFVIEGYMIVRILVWLPTEPSDPLLVWRARPR